MRTIKLSIGRFGLQSIFAGRILYFFPSLGGSLGSLNSFWRKIVVISGTTFKFVRAGYGLFFLGRERRHLFMFDFNRTIAILILAFSLKLERRRSVLLLSCDRSARRRAEIMFFKAFLVACFEILKFVRHFRGRLFNLLSFYGAESCDIMRFVVKVISCFSLKRIRSFGASMLLIFLKLEEYCSYRSCKHTFHGIYPDYRGSKTSVAGLVTVASNKIILRR